VPERVVDLLEVVEVHEQQGDRPGRPAVAGEGPLEVVAEQDPVRQPGQRVVQRVVDQLRLEALAVGDLDEQALRDAPAAAVSSAIANASSRTQISGPSRAIIRYSARSGSPVRQWASYASIAGRGRRGGSGSATAPGRR
jgi:hypothetical protein